VTAATAEPDKPSHWGGSVICSLVAAAQRLPPVPRLRGGDRQRLRATSHCNTEIQLGLPDGTAIVREAISLRRSLVPRRSAPRVC
jgi:hypothetical protein